MNLFKNTSLDFDKISFRHADVDLSLILMNHSRIVTTKGEYSSIVHGFEGRSILTIFKSERSNH